MLSELSGAAIDDLARGGAVLTLGLGETLFSEGDEDDRYFVVMLGGRSRSASVAGGDACSRPTTAVARSPARLLMVGGEQIRARLAAAQYR